MLFDDVLPIAGETQLRTDGLHISSYATDEDGLPYLSPSARPVLRQALRDKQRFETGAPCWERMVWDEIGGDEAVVESQMQAQQVDADEFLPWALEHDTETARIIQEVQAKAALWQPPRPAPPAQPVTIHRKVLPQPGDGDTEEHTSSISDEPSNSVASVAGPSWQSELMPAIAHLNAESELSDIQMPEALPWKVQGVTDKLPEPLPDATERRLRPVKPRRAWDMSATSSAPVTGLSVTRVRLTEKERQTAIRLGLKSPGAASYRASSVLDGYEPVQRPGRRSPVPSKNLLVKRVVAQNEKCGYCDRLFGSMVVIDGNFVTLKAEPDHFMPRAKRLNNSPSNIVAACQVCNGLKSSRSFSTIDQARIVLQAAWRERGWSDAPLLVPYKLTMPLCLN